FQGGIDLFNQSLQILEEIYGSEGAALAYPLNNLAAILLGNDQDEDAIPFLERAMNIRKAAQGEENPLYADMIQMMAGIHYNLGDIEKSEELYRQSLEIKRRILGESHPSINVGLVGLGWILRDKGEMDAAHKLFLQAAELAESTWGEDHLRAHEILNSYASFLEYSGDWQLAVPARMRVMRLALERLERELPTMSEAARIELLEEAAYPEMLLFGVEETQEDRAAEVYSLFLRWKGMATRLAFAAGRIRGSEGSAEIDQSRDRVHELGRSISELILLPVDDQASNHAEQLASLRMQRKRLEVELNRSLGLSKFMKVPNLKEIQEQMPKNSVLLDFYIGAGVYVWVLQRDKTPKLLRLGAQKDLRSLLDAQLKTVVNRGGKSIKATNESLGLWNFLWVPLKASLDGCSQVFLCPDGELGELSFGTMSAGDGHYLIEDHRFTYLSDATRLIQENPLGSSKEGPVFVVGDVNYFKRDSVGVADASVDSSRSRLGQQWSSLSATREEIQAVQDLHTYVLEWESELTVLTGTSASEEQIRLGLPGNRYLHLATHGYFEPEHLPSLVADLGGRRRENELVEQRRAVGMLPGLLSGLVFAGVNAEAKTSLDDGYLSAEEIQHLDLSACDLAVLSACETALGSARSGEGLMSLRRAFEVAGARTVVSSLWKVDDQSTANLMSYFYQNLWQKGLPKGEALHQARLKLLHQNRADFKGDAMPSTWGAFVLSGDWN
ncbi:MAG: CHAT domain-containing protein, partial [Planctomycetes bacterium]|nr:CHAT domain-containing protein [Planctomycetota bacterium]